MDGLFLKEFLERHPTWELRVKWRDPNLALSLDLIDHAAGRRLTRMVDGKSIDKARIDLVSIELDRMERELGEHATVTE